MIFLGVDGGGTTTTFCIVSSAGEVLGRAVEPSSYYLNEAIDLVERVLTGGVAQVCERAGIAPTEIGYAFVGLPTYGEVSADVPRLDALTHAALGHDRYTCGNDMVCGWAGSLGAQDGVNVISGTGSMTYGEHDGRKVRVGGWGELFGDEGSGYWIAVAGLRAFSRMSDGRAPRGPLLDILASHLSLGSELDLVDVVLNRWHADRSTVASLSLQVARAAHAGDSAALAILEKAGVELATLVRTTRSRLGWQTSDPVPVSYSGGVFGEPLVRASFEHALTADGERFDLRVPLFEPVVGACLYAARLAGAPLSGAARAQLRTRAPSERNAHESSE